MSDTISIDELAKAVYNKYKLSVDEISSEVLEAASDSADKCLESIKGDSPSSNDSEGSKSYKNGWVKRKTRNGYVIYNKNKPWLEMPLEHGHIIKRGAKRGERTQAKPHIYKNADKYRNEFYSKCVKIVDKGSSK